MDAQSRPALRAVESIVVPDREHGRVVVLRDTQGISDAQAALPPVLIPIASRFNGRLTCEEIAREASGELGVPVPVEVVVHLAGQLEASLFLEGPVFHEARVRVEREFVEAAVRPASHAGAAYHGERGALEKYIEQSCLARAGDEPRASRTAGMVALIAPHIDPWRGAVGYGHAYRALASAISPEVDTFILFGTSHAPMRAPFALCRKAFDTPLGPALADTSSVDTLAAAADGFDPYSDQFNHKREHSLEFQVVFLKHVLKGRDFRIVPVLAGLGAAQASRRDPSDDARVARFVEGVRAILDARPGRTLIVAGADLAHIGPRFGDAKAYGEDQRIALEQTDRTSLAHASGLDAAGFWAHVSADLDQRRVCGLAPIWALLSSIRGSRAQGRLLHYEQTVDKGDGSIVSHAALGFFA
jgi:MEMO1 family protein